MLNTIIWAGLWLVLAYNVGILTFLFLFTWMVARGEVRAPVLTIRGHAAPRRLAWVMLAVLFAALWPPTAWALWRPRHTK